MVIVVLIVLGFFFNAFMDAIDHGKGAETLRYLWHFVKYVDYGIVVVFGILIGRETLMVPLRNILIKAGVGTILGLVVWRIAYYLFRLIPWHEIWWA